MKRDPLTTKGFTLIILLNVYVLLSWRKKVVTELGFLKFQQKLKTNYFL